MRKNRLSSGVLCLCLIPALAGWPTRALAQAGDKAAAEVLFNEGRQQMQEGKLDSACDKLAESQRLDPGAGTLLNLAECRERQGRTATAWATWLEAAAAAHTAGQAEREAHARKRAEGLKPRLVTLTLEVPEASRISGLEVSRDGVALGPAMWGVAVPVDPGAHTLTAKALGREPWTQTVTVVEGTPAKVVIPPLALAATPATASPENATPEAASTAALPPNLAPRPDAPRARKVSPLVYVAAGVGVVGVAVGTVFGLRAIAKNDDSNAKGACSGNRCFSDKGLEDRNAALDAAKASNAGFVIGGLGIAAAVAIWVTAPKVSTAPAVGLQRPRLRNAGVMVLPGRAELAVEGVF